MKEGDIFEKEYQVTERIYSLFIQAFDDKNPLHVDKAFATKFKFPDRVMHGAILNGFLSNFIGECLPQKNVLVQSYNINFSKPVYQEQKLKFCAKITGVYDSVNSIEFKFTFQNAENDIVAKGSIGISIISL